MSLKAKLEAVIYAAEEPVTLTQLASLFAAEALEWKAEQEAASAEEAAEDAADAAQPLLGEDFAYLGEDVISTPTDVQSTDELVKEAAVSDDKSVSISDSEANSEAVAEATQEAEVNSESAVEVLSGQEAVTQPEGVRPEAAVAAPVDVESELKRQARLRDREVRAILRQLLDEIVADCTTDGRGVEIREIAGGYRMATKPECHDAVRLFVKSLKPPLKLSLAALETLAVIAYKQPVTAPEVSEIRGVEAAGVLGSLLARKLIATAGRKQVIGRPILYKTTKAFLLRFGLKDVAELPSMEEFEKMAAIELEEPEPATEEAPEPAETEPAFDENAELESNSPSGEELAAATVEATEAAEVLARKEATEALENDKDPESVTDSTAVMEAETQAALADKTPTEATPAEPDSTLQ